MSSAVLAWLEAELGRPVHRPAADEAMATLRERLLGEREVVVFGAGGAGEAAARMLLHRGVEVVAFADSHRRGTLLDRPVIAPEEMPLGTPVVLASTWFFEMARRVPDRVCYPLPDPSILHTELFDDLAGAPFLAFLEERLAEVRSVHRLWDDAASARLYLDLIDYRLRYLAPLTIDASAMPCSPKAFAARSASPLPFADGALPGQLEGALRHLAAHAYYEEAGFLVARDGDRVIDGGAWIGDSAIWYAVKVGATGRVHAFEPGARALAALRAGVAAAGLEDRVETLALALARRPQSLSWCEIADSDQSSGFGPGASRVEATSIDAFVAERALPGVDLIKLDLEGADLDALCGAEQTVRRCRPDLAVSIYHAADHLVEVPLTIRALDGGYRLRLSHRHLAATETVCLATVRGAD